MIDTIVRALNKWLEVKFPSKTGWFIGRTYEEDTQFKAYKKCISQIYYHIENKNHLAINLNYIINKSTFPDIQKDRMYTEFLGGIFIGMDELEKLIKDVEQIPDTV